MSPVRAFWEELFRPVKIILVTIGVIILAVIIVLVIGAVTAEAADLKCVTIKFKNDSELKLKTQWFINVVDTVGWEHIPVVNWTDSMATEDYVLRPILRSYRTLLFPPDVRKEPTSKRVYNDDGSWDCITTKGKIDEDGWQRYFMIPVRDTIPGEALLWYEETR